MALILLTWLDYHREDPEEESGRCEIDSARWDLDRGEQETD